MPKTKQTQPFAQKAGFQPFPLLNLRYEEIWLSGNFSAFGITG
jgi:hypothetical protein